MFNPFTQLAMLMLGTEKAMAPHSSTLAWKIPWMEEPGRLQSMGLLRVGHDWATSLSVFTFVHWRRKWQPTPVFLPGESQGWGAWWATVYGVAQSQTRLKLLRSMLGTAQVEWLIDEVRFFFSYCYFTNLITPWANFPVRSHQIRALLTFFWAGKWAFWCSHVFASVNSPTVSYSTFIEFMLLKVLSLELHDMDPISSFLLIPPYMKKNANCPVMWGKRGGNSLEC